MPADDITLRLRLEADGKGFVGDIRLARREVDKLQGSTKRTSTATKQASAATQEASVANRRYAQSAGRVQAANRGVSRSFLKAHGRALQYFGVAAGAGSAGLVVRGAIRQADAYTELNNRLRLVTDSEAQLVNVRGRLLALSQRTRTELAANAALYSRLSLAARATGRSQAELIEITELLNKQVAIGGNNSVEAAAGLTQFAQGIASGRLQGDELRSVLENLQGVSEGLLVGFKRLRDEGKLDLDVTRANIRSLAAEGKLGAKQLLDAILASADDTNRKFADVNTTVAGALTQIGNAALQAVGHLDSAAGSSNALADGLSGVAQFLEQISLNNAIEAVNLFEGALRALVAVGVSRVVGGLYAAAAASAAAARENLRYQRTLAAMAGHSRIAATRLIGFSVAARAAGTAISFLGGPLGVALLAAYAIYEFASANKAAKDSLAGLPEGVDLLTGSVADLDAKLKKLGPAQLEVAISARVTNIEDVEGKLQAAKERLNDLEQGRVSKGSFSPFAGATDFVNRDKKITRQRAKIEGLEQERADLNKEIENLRGVRDRREQRTAVEKPARRYNPKDGIALDVTQEDKRTLATLTTATERAQAEYDKLTTAIKKNTEAGSGKQKNLLALAGVQHKQTLASIRARKAEAEAQRQRATGTVVLAELRKRHQALTAALGGSAEAIAEQTTKARIQNQVNKDYPNASEETRQAIVNETLAVEAAEQAIQSLTEARRLDQQAQQQAVELVQVAENRYAREISALEALQAQPEQERRDQGIDDRLVAIEIERLKAEQILSVKYAYWEQELLAARGYRSRVLAEEVAHKQALIDEESRHAQKVGSIRKKIVEFENKTGREKLQTGLEIAEESFGHLAAHSQKAFRLQQAAAIANAAISIAQGVAKALSKGFPVGLAEAALITAAGAAQIAAIRSQQPPKAFARGGVVESATYFSARGIARGVAGEAGPEAIMPLRRTPSGELGVKSVVEVRVAVVNKVGEDVHARASARRDADGGVNLTIELDRAVARAITGGENTRSALARNYGLRPPLVGR